MIWNSAKIIYSSAVVVVADDDVAAAAAVLAVKYFLYSLKNSLELN